MSGDNSCISINRHGIPDTAILVVAIALGMFFGSYLGGFVGYTGAGFVIGGLFPICIAMVALYRRLIRLKAERVTQKR